MKYLQKVIAVTADETCMGEIEKLGKSLQGEEIKFEYLLVDSRHTQWIQAYDNRIEDNSKLQVGEMASRLWITDNSDLAAELRRKGEAVLAFLHAGNANQDFFGILYACEQLEELDADYMERVYRRYKGLPWDVAVTDRCIVRETTEEDVEAFFEIYSNPEITQYNEKLYPTLEQEKQYVREYREKIYGFYGFGVWTVLKKDTGEVIGRVGFSYREGYEEPEIGFIIGVPWQRQGYAEEVCSTLLKYGEEELGFSTVQAFVIPGNKASIHLCEKLGLHKIGSENIAGIMYDRFQKIF